MTILRGVMETAFENFVCLRGFAALGDLANISEPDPSYQRDLIDIHEGEMQAFLEKGAYLFFPEIVLSGFGEAEEMGQLRSFLVGSETRASRIHFGQNSLTLAARDYKSSADQRIRERVVNASLNWKTDAPKLKRIDGNHRLSAVADPANKARRYLVPFCLVLFEGGDSAQRFSRAVFHNINFKQVPLAMEHNLKLILDETEENLKNFPDDVLRDDPSFGVSYVRARKLLPKLNLDFLDNIKNTLFDDSTAPPQEWHRTFALELLKALEAKQPSKQNVFSAIKHVNALYAQHPALKKSRNRGLLTAFVNLALDEVIADDNVAAKSRLQRFTGWVVNGHLAELKEIKAEDLLAIFEKLETAKNRQVFVAMAFREETKATFQAIQDAIDTVNTSQGLEITLKPVRIDQFEQWHSYPIRDEIMRLIEECGYLIADLTYGNPNVYHEIGYLFGLNKMRQKQLLDNCVLIWNEGRMPLKNEKMEAIEANDVRFDLKHFGQIRFKDTNSLRTRLTAALQDHYRV